MELAVQERLTVSPIRRGGGDSGWSVMVTGAVGETEGRCNESGENNIILCASQQQWQLNPLGLVIFIELCVVVPINLAVHVNSTLPCISGTVSSDERAISLISVMTCCWSTGLPSSLVQVREGVGFASTVQFRTTSGGVSPPGKRVIVGMFRTVRRSRNSV